jgi:hypothetical protein
MAQVQQKRVLRAVQSPLFFHSEYVLVTILSFNLNEQIVLKYF